MAHAGSVVITPWCTLARRSPAQAPEPCAAKLAVSASDRATGCPKLRQASTGFDKLLQASARLSQAQPARPHRRAISGAISGSFSGSQAASRRPRRPRPARRRRRRRGGRPRRPTARARRRRSCDTPPHAWREASRLGTVDIFGRCIQLRNISGAFFKDCTCQHLHRASGTGIHTAHRQNAPHWSSGASAAAGAPLSLPAA